MKNDKKHKAKFLAIAEIYATMIEPIEGETYTETAKRLSLEVGERVQPTVFDLAVSMVRSSKYNQTTTKGLVYRHCIWCNGIFKQQKEVQKFCSGKCRNGFSENRKHHGGHWFNDPITNKTVYNEEPSRVVIDQYPNSKI